MEKKEGNRKIPHDKRIISQKKRKGKFEKNHKGTAAHTESTTAHPIKAKKQIL
jgi:hypothetical protein